MQNRYMGEVKEHYKMYKKGKIWTFSLVLLGTTFLFTSQTDSIHAAAQTDLSSSSVTEQEERQSVTSAVKTSSSTSSSIEQEKQTTSSSSSLSASAKTETKAENTISIENETKNGTGTTTSAADVSSESADSASSRSKTEEPVSEKNISSAVSSSAVSSSSAKEDIEDTTSSVEQDSTVSSSSIQAEQSSTEVSQKDKKDVENLDTKTNTVSTVVVKDEQQTSSVISENKTYDEEYRNQFHFSPAQNWMNDPNGLFYDEKTGLYHLYYQYNPEGNEWGNMSWGHATSKDMVNWTQEQLAIPMLDNQGWEDFTYTNTTGNLAKYGEVRYVGVPTTNWGDSNGKKAIFSGSIYVDKDNISGLGKGAILAFYTADYQIATRINDGEDNGWGTWIGLSEIQEQHLAYSLDGGTTFIQYSSDGNSAEPKPLIPVTASEGGDAANFRDPNVVYDEQNKQFLMTVVSNQQALIYKSQDLLHWEYASSIQRQKNVGAGVWECPTLIPMTVSGTNITKWIFAVSVQQGAHATGSGMEYYVGNINANGEWLPESKQTMNSPMTFDYGEDFYAGIPFANMKDKRNVLIAWQSNWSYTGDAKTSPWYGNMTLPRELQLVKSSEGTDGYLLKNTVVSEIKNNEQQNVISKSEANLTIENSEQKIEYEGNQYKITAKFSWNAENQPESVGFKLRVSDDGKYYILVGYDLKTQKFFVQRLNTGEPNMGDPRDQMNAFVNTDNGTITLTVYVDETSIEAFANEGEKTITQNFFLRPEYIGAQATNQLYLYVQNGTAQITDLTVNPLASIWSNEAKIIYNYVDEHGKKIAPSKEFTGKIGDTYSLLEASKIKGYFLSRTDAKNTNQVNLYTAQDQEVNYIYQNIQTDILTKDTTLTAGPNTKWTAADNFIGGTDITGKALLFKDVKVVGAVDPTKAGTYYIRYSYTDSQGNTVSKKARVRVLETANPNKDSGGAYDNKANGQRNHSLEDKNTAVWLHNSKDNDWSRSGQVSGTIVKEEQRNKNGSLKNQIVSKSTANTHKTGKNNQSIVEKGNKEQLQLPQTGAVKSSIMNVWGTIIVLLSSIGILFSFKGKKSRK